MRFTNAAFAAALPVLAFGAPAPNAPSAVSSAASALFSAVHSAECKAVNVVVTVLELMPTATPFCSSYLGIQTVTTSPTTTVTAVVTTTSTSIPVTVVTTTVTAPTTTISTCSGTVVSSSSASPSSGSNKRNILPPAALPGALSAFAASQVSTACLCLNIPTPTSTVIVTTTATSTSVTITTSTSTSITTATYTPSTTIESCPAPTACGNQGLGFAVYPNTDGANNQEGYPNFDPEGYKDVTPECTGVTNSLGGFDYPENPNGVTIYGQCTLSSSAFFTLNQRGYIYAQESGAYTFSASNIDDIVELWIGSTAYSGWTRANANLDQAIFQSAQPFTITLTAGQYYPVRIVFGQAQGAAAFDMTVTAPDGSVFLGPDSGASPYLISYSCDGTTAPAFPTFGQET